MGMSWSGMGTNPGFVVALRAGEKFAEDDEETLETPSVVFYDLDNGFAIEGSKAQLVRLLEDALQQARELPDDE